MEVTFRVDFRELQRAASVSPRIDKDIERFTSLWNETYSGQKSPFEQRPPAFQKTLIHIGSFLWDGLGERDSVKVLEAIQSIALQAIAGLTLFSPLFKKTSSVEDRLALIHFIRKNQHHPNWPSIVSRIEASPERSFPLEFFHLIFENPQFDWERAYAFAKEHLGRDTSAESVMKFIKLIFEAPSKNWENPLKFGKQILDAIRTEEGMIKLANFIAISYPEREALFDEAALFLQTIFEPHPNLWILPALAQYIKEHPEATEKVKRVKIFVLQRILSNASLRPNHPSKKDLSFIENIEAYSMNEEVLSLGELLWSGARGTPVNRYIVLETLEERWEEVNWSLIIQETTNLWTKMDHVSDRIIVLESIISTPLLEWDNAIEMASPLLPLFTFGYYCFQFLILPMANFPTLDWKRVLFLVPKILEPYTHLGNGKLHGYEDDLSIFEEIAKNPNLHWEERIDFARRFWEGTDPLEYQTNDQLLSKKKLIESIGFPIPPNSERALNITMQILEGLTPSFYQRHLGYHFISSNLDFDWEGLLSLFYEVLTKINSAKERAYLLLFIYQHQDQNWGEILHLSRQIYDGALDGQESQIFAIYSVYKNIGLNLEDAIRVAKEDLRWHRNTCQERIKLVLQAAIYIVPSLL